MRSGEYSLTCEPIYDKGNNLFCIKERPTKTDQQAFRKPKANSNLYLEPFTNKQTLSYKLPHRITDCTILTNCTNCRQQSPQVVSYLGSLDQKWLTPHTHHNAHNINHIAQNLQVRFQVKMQTFISNFANFISEVQKPNNGSSLESTSLLRQSKAIQEVDESQFV